MRYPSEIHFVCVCVWGGLRNSEGEMERRGL